MTSGDIPKCQLTNLGKVLFINFQIKSLRGKNLTKERTSTGHECHYYCSPSVQIFFHAGKKPRRFSTEGKNTSCSLEICMIVLFLVHWVSSEMTCQEHEGSLILETHFVVPMKKYPRDHAVHSRFIPGYQNCSIT